MGILIFLIVLICLMIAPAFTFAKARDVILHTVLLVVVVVLFIALVESLDSIINVETIDAAFGYIGKIFASTMEFIYNGSCNAIAMFFETFQELYAESMQGFVNLGASILDVWSKHYIGYTFGLCIVAVLLCAQEK